MDGPDHKSSIEPDELRQMVAAIRNIELAMGDGIKRPSVSEFKNRDVVRKSIVASKRIDNGDIFSVDNLTVKRPGNGLSPMFWDKILQKRANKRYEKDELRDP
jgi:N,N'-diacetyllegionaminate synthase